MAECIAVAMNKGGTGKTVTAVSLAAVAAQRGRRTLIVDGDHQGNALLSFGGNADTLDYTLSDVLKRRVTAREAVHHLRDRLDILPASDDLALLDFEVLSDRDRYPAPFQLLKRVIEPLREDYDLIVIDSPPSLGLMTSNILVAADSAIIPVQTEHFALRGLAKVVEAIRILRQRQSPGLAIRGILPTMVDSRTTLAAEVLQEIRRHYHGRERVFETVIPRSVRFAAAPAYHQLPAVLIDAHNPLVLAYHQLYEEVFHAQ